MSLDEILSPKTKEAAHAVASVVEELGAFLGAEETTYASRMPPEWKVILS